MRVYKLGSNITTERFGGKAKWLNWLFNHGVKIPDTYFLPAMTSADADKLLRQKSFLAELQEVVSNIDGALAVRSSAICEDGAEESKAGNFLTCLYVHGLEETAAAIRRVVASAPDNTKMGVVLQTMIEPDIAGIIFSSNPVNASKDEVVVSLVKGQGEKLVSGHDGGENFIITPTKDGFVLPSQATNVDKSILLELSTIAKNIEKILKYPVDIEWCYKRGLGLTILQCRPITTIFIPSQTCKITNKQLEKIPPKLINSDKITLRLLAEKHGIRMSDGHLIMCNCTGREFSGECEIKKSPDCRGYSVVLLYPVRLNKKIIRSFVGDKDKVSKESVSNNYIVMSLPDYDSLQKCLCAYYKMVKKHSWIMSVIVQEIYDPIYTGIIKKANGNFIIEFTKGHFASKGVVPMSSYIVDAKGKILYKNEIMQSKHIGIIEGCKLEYDDTKSKQKLVYLPENEIKNIISTFRPIFSEKDVTVEFGVLKKHGGYEFYLIDCTYEKMEDHVDLSVIERGVLSAGKIEGKIKFLDDVDFDQSLNAHFYNEIEEEKATSNKNVIFHAKLPNIKFLDILGKYDNSRIGFVFESGSLLCHLSVLLRERGIPAIIGVNRQTLSEGDRYILDTNAKQILVKK